MTNTDFLPLISAVIPTRNRPELVLRAVRSALCQTYRNLEAIVVIDGPDPATVAALKTLTDDRVRVVALERNVGGSDARNIGVRNAIGDWIAFLDDDDEWLPDKLEKQAALAAWVTDPFPVITTQLLAKSPYGNFIWPRRLPRDSEPVCEYLFNRHSFFTGEGQLQTSTLLTKRSLMEQVPFTSGLPKHQDIDWYLRVSKTPGARFHFVCEPLVNLYVEENRQTISSRSDWRYSLNWLKSSRERVSPRAYAGFICTIIATEAYRQGQWSAVPQLLREAFRNGKPGIMDLTLFAGRWILPPSFRGKMRSWRHSIAVKQTA